MQSAIHLYREVPHHGGRERDLHEVEAVRRDQQLLLGVGSVHIVIEGLRELHGDRHIALVQICV